MENEENKHSKPHCGIASKFTIECFLYPQNPVRNLDIPSESDISSSDTLASSSRFQNSENCFSSLKSEALHGRYTNDSVKEHIINSFLQPLNPIIKTSIIRWTVIK